jgi:tetratricopeptide (TPR) repeat protein
MRRLLIYVGAPVLAVAAALTLVLAGGVVGGGHRAAAPAPSTPVAADRLADAIARAQDRLRTLPKDWRTWAGLASAYVEQARVTANPAYYQKAEGAAQQSLTLHPEGNTDALVALGALANARHDFAAARADADKALAVDRYSADAYGVLADAQTQLGDAGKASDAIQHMLDLRPGLPAYARASYDLELHGRTDEATDLMRRALAAATDPHDIAFCRNQLGDLAWQHGDLTGARREYTAGLAADPTSIALRRGMAQVDAASGDLDRALTAYGDVTRRAPTPGYLIEYADLLRAAGREADADAPLSLADAAVRLFTANGGTDDLVTASLAIAAGRPADAVRAARAEWARRQHVDVADTLAWSLHLAGQDAEALGYARRVADTGARNAGYAYHLGAIEAALGQRDAARSDLTRALDTNPHFSPLEAPVARQLLTKVAS